ncbi:alpha/beta hydrolase [Microbulbifer agarilyticus]|uniref:alpha/beta fold hydrolase n=1 Tax=Microbulbifer agarilyticus TaxID=260552 RepID=UPI001C96C78D|nr:alpha/beta hydrolase [Microbulbifer agarilyticus]MBY6190918.1 alpha/beta hydrolase [Microbulbifer agarilyticus]
MPYAINRGLHIHYRVTGYGAPLVLQHGSTSRLEAWNENGYVDALRDQFQLIMIDGRGHGQSDKPHEQSAYDLPNRVGDVICVLDALGLTRVHYWGYSMGGWIGFGMAAHARERLASLVIGGAHPYADTATAFAEIDGGDPDAFMTALEKFTGARATAEVRRRILNNDLRALAAAMHSRCSLEHILPGIEVPTLLYVGEQDPRANKVQRCAADLIRGHSEVLPGLDHASASWRSDLVIPQVLPFLLEQPFPN